MGVFVVGRPVDALKVINNTMGRICPDYDLSMEQLNAIKNSHDQLFNIICNAFVFGYTQGVKAQKKGRAYNAKNPINQK